MSTHRHTKCRSAAFVVCSWMLLFGLVAGPLQAAAAGLSVCGEACCPAGGRLAAVSDLCAADNGHGCGCSGGSTCHLATAAAVGARPAVEPAASQTRIDRWIHGATAAGGTPLRRRPGSAAATPGVLSNPPGTPLYLHVCRLII